MKTIVLLSILSLSAPVFAKTKGDDFKEKYLFTHLRKTTKTEPVDDVSKCFKFHKVSQEVLQSYDQCRKDPNLPSPLEEAMGTCIRKDGANAYFFEDMKECESARVEVVESLKD
ncbi:hypothetical protein [Bdellovibrio sp. HCB337]|uniref:hypothetical protein n=1 Tax=Bdellovibrio sp. HCB337 TaxID=3394358 RepID=UPI0039A670AB